MTTLAQQLEQLEQDVLNYMKVTAASGQSMREAIDRFAAIRAALSKAESEP